MARVATDVRPISYNNLEALVHVINGSSSGHVFQFDTDAYKFLALSRFWNLSYAHSLLAYSDNRPAGVILNAVNPDAREAFTLYWGVLPEFRGGRIAMALVDAYFSLLHRQGYHRTDADETHGSPSPIYKKLGYRPNQVFADIETDSVEAPDGSGSLEIRKLSLQELIALHADFPGFRYWSQRPYFLHHAGRFIDILGVFRDEHAEGYLVRTFSTGHLVILDFRFRDAGAAWALLKNATEAGAPPPITASFVPIPGATYDLLSEAGFTGFKRFTSMTLDLSAPGSRFVRRSFR